MRWLRRRQQGVLGDLNNDVFLKSEMKNVVKYDAKFDILLVGSIYVTTYTYIYIYIYIYVYREGKPEIPIILQTPSSGLRHSYYCYCRGMFSLYVAFLFALC